MKREVCFTKKDDALVAMLDAEIDHHTARTIRESIDNELFKEKPSLLVLDFSGVSFMDSSGVGLILGRAELCREIGCRVRLSGLSRTLMKIVRLSGIEKIDNIFISDI